MCSCGQTFGVSAIAAITSEVKSRGCGEVNRTRSSPGDRPAGAQQLREGAAVAELDPVGVDVLPEQRHLQHPVRGQRRRPRPARRRGGGPSPCRAATARCRTCRCCCSPPRSTPSPRRPTRAAPAASTGTPRATRRSPPGPSALCRARSSSTGSACTLCVPNTTSTHGARRTISARSFCARQPPTAICMPGPGGLHRAQVAEVAVEPVVGVLPDRAGVEDDDVGGLVGVGRADVAGRLEQPGHPLGVVHVHLAPVGADGVAAGHGA